MNKSRENVTTFIRKQFASDNMNSKHDKYHYGRYELKELLDYMYDQIPQNENQNLNCKYTWEQ